MLAVDAVGRDEWTTISLLREVPRATALQFTFELHGCGEMLVDDVTIRRAGTTAATDLPVELAVPSVPEDKSSPLDLIPDFPRFPLWSRGGREGDQE